jgi:hypothetical protein
MHDVREFPFSVPCKTRIWFSDKAAKEVARFRKKSDPSRTFWKRLLRCAQNGFALYEIGDWPMVKEEWEGVYRFGVRDSLFRLIGFYEDASRSSFVVIDTLLKKGQKLTTSDKARIDEVVRVKKNRLWRKVADERDFPRIVE